MEQTEREEREAIASYERPPDEPYGGAVEIVICPSCDGTGDDPENPERECPVCKGEGEVPEDEASL